MRTVVATRAAQRVHQPGGSRRGLWIPLSSLALVGILGCGLPPHARLQEARRSWQASAVEAAPSSDPFGEAAVLQREALLRALLERNPSLRAARQGWRAALERFPQVTSLDDPQIGFGAAPDSFGESGLDTAYAIDLSQHLPFPGKRALRGEVALAEAEAAGGDFAAVRLRLATMGSLLYDEYYFIARALEINTEHLALLEAFQRIAFARYEVGEATQQDPLQAELELARLLQREIELQTARRVLRQQLNALLHRPIDAELPAAPSVLELPDLPAEPLDAVELAAGALQARPELGAASARVRAREAEVEVAQREFLPDFTLVGNYNRRLPVEENRPFVGLRLNLPLRLERRRAALEEARARLAGARSEQEGLVDELRLDLHRALENFRQAREVEALFGARLLPTARDRVAAARAGFETGRNSFLELIDAERDLRQVELGAERAVTDLSRRSAELLRALGRIPGLEEERS